jgi:hypothetical protein
MKNSQLGMLDVSKQLCLHGGVGCSSTQVATTGLSEVVYNLFDGVIQGPRPPTAPGPSVSADGLTPKELTNAIRDRLAASEELSEPPPDLAPLQTRAEVLTEVRAKKGRVYPAVVRLAEETIAEVVVRLHEYIDRRILECPAIGPEVVDQMRAVLRQVPSTVPHAGAHSKFQRGLRTVEAFALCAGEVTRKTYTFVSAELLRDCLERYVEALTELAGELARSALHRATEGVLAYLAEWMRQLGEYMRRADDARFILKEKEKESAKLRAAARSTVVLDLPGPDKGEILGTMTREGGCTDPTQLVDNLRVKFEAQLRAFARERVPTLGAGAPLFKLVLALDPGEVADQFVRLVGSCPGGHTLYDLIERKGVAVCADYLYRHAAPTCDLGGRNVARHNVPAEQLTIVCLPAPVGPRDPGVRDRLQMAFAKLGHCIFTEGAPGAAVTVVRLELGWPIGIEQSNRALLQRYLRAGAAGHAPHLLNVLDASPTGQIDPNYRLLTDDPN